MTLLLLTAASWLAASETSLTLDPLIPIEPGPELTKFAAEKNIPLRGIDLVGSDASLELDDSVTLLVTLMKDQHVQQWLIRLWGDRLTESERNLPLAPDAVIHTSTGRTLSYAHSRAALRVELTGPFASGLSPAMGYTSSPPVRNARTVVNGNYLKAGMADYCRSGLDIARRIESAGIKNPIYFAGSAKAPPETVEKGRRFSDSINLTENEEREAFSVYFAFTTFFNAAMAIPACRELLEEVVEKPSVWSVARNLGVRTDFHYFWTDARAIADGRVGVPLPVYQMPVQVFLNGKCGVKATLAVTIPRAPLVACAGILALCAEHPTVPSRRLFIRTLAAQRATVTSSRPTD